MDPHRYSCIKLLTFSLPLLCLLSWSWPAASTNAPPPSSALLAADSLRTRGYSLFASMVVSLSTTANFSGTLFAPPDFAFSPAAAKFLNSRRPPPRPSISLLLYHTIRPPLALAWPALSSRDDGYEFPTLYNNNCLYLSRSPYGGEISISSTPYKNPMVAVKIRQPDLFVDAHLTVHGIDGVLDPSLAVKCNIPFPDPMADDAVPPKVNRTFLDHAMRALRRTGYNVVAAAMAIRRYELLSLTSVTVFAVSDENLFLKPGGFRFNFRHHVVPMRRRFADLAKITTDGGAALDTLAPNKTVLVNSVDGAVSVDGVAVDETEVYRNRWMVVMSLMASLDDVVVDSQFKPPINVESSPSPAPFPGVPANGNSPSTAPAYAPPSLAREINPADAYSIGTPSPAASELDGEIGDYAPVTAPTIGSPSPAADDVNETHCDLSTIVSIGVEGGDLLCPVSTVRQLREMNDDVDESRPLDAGSQVADDLTPSDEVKIAENVNIADDVFFYI
ncbi:hypothetical protein PHJA_001003200 [Phtheirospermum japonicum]|uniref:FAS1 domain-containing protein n=1 Tax=Phtheirospermum japonicum TaxID=374723 RepID=A0A830BZF0_9LAMI|nr:hypothetical protein PHJA_001003200 [Phtheirospermum japonicum]